jgi:hypothetical protein
MIPEAISKALKMYDRSIVEFEDGKISNADKVLESFRTEWKDFYTKVGERGTDPATPPQGGANDYAGKTATELMEEANRNPEKLNEIMAQIEAMNKPKKE